MKWILATNNEHKVEEFLALLQTQLTSQQVEVFSPKQLGLRLEVEEDADSFLGNATKKVEALQQSLAHSMDAQLPLLADTYLLADDSGLCVDLLDGRPGVHSARYAGEETPYADKFAKLWSELKAQSEDCSRWTAAFVCCLACYSPKTGRIHSFFGQTKGRILPTVRGEGGFGYDPIFYSEDAQKGMAELSLSQKNALSHRGRALEQLLEALKAGEI